MMRRCLAFVAVLVLSTGSLVAQGRVLPMEGRTNEEIRAGFPAAFEMDSAGNFMPESVLKNNEELSSFFQAYQNLLSQLMWGINPTGQPVRMFVINCVNADGSVARVNYQFYDPVPGVRVQRKMVRTLKKRTRKARLDYPLPSAVSQCGSVTIPPAPAE